MKVAGSGGPDSLSIGVPKAQEASRKGGTFHGFNPVNTPLAAAPRAIAELSRPPGQPSPPAPLPAGEGRSV